MSADRWKLADMRTSREVHSLWRMRRVASPVTTQVSRRVQSSQMVAEARSRVTKSAIQLLVIVTHRRRTQSSCA